MPAAIGGALPSLSQIMGWDTEHLTRASADWSATAEHWEDTFESVHRGMLAPGSTVWEGEAADAAQERAFADLVKVRGLADILTNSATVARRGADQLDYLKRQAIDAIEEAREAGFTVSEDLSVTDTSKYSGLRIAAMRQFATTIATRAAALSAADKDVAAKIVTATTELNGRGFSESPETVQALDVPLAPPPDPSYPVNDVIAEATDLDGNHVVLRRGYYDGKQGFGWDKIFHKHGITNPNVFTDLISHSRPISNKNGRLEYQVEVDRTRCSQLFGPIYDCEDTGESLDMKILVDTTENRWDVPDGGQKGVITMYPLEGGDGVVVVQPNWTMAPPWVSGNVPIN
ncbi:WXG100 family type VII secretion target [Mycolicibacterium sp. CBM1]